MLSNKEITEYFFDEQTPLEGHISYDSYEKRPATAFLQYANDITDAVEVCKNYFPFDYEHRIGSLANIQNIINSFLATFMSHFETYEKHLFAGIFERSVYFNNFQSNFFFKNIYNGKVTQIEISTMQMLGYRNFTTSSGMLIADSLKGWHDPVTVNKYFKAFGFNCDFFSNEDITDLKILWQLRHSIVHTAATITRSDSQKVPQIINMGDREIVFKNKFIYELAKRFHGLILCSTNRMKECTQKQLDSSLNNEKIQEIMLLFEVKSNKPYMFN